MTMSCGQDLEEKKTAAQEKKAQLVAQHDSLESKAEAQREAARRRKEESKGAQAREQAIKEEQETRKEARRQAEAQEAAAERQKANLLKEQKRAKAEGEEDGDGKGEGAPALKRLKRGPQEAPELSGRLSPAAVDVAPPSPAGEVSAPRPPEKATGGGGFQDGVQGEGDGEEHPEAVVREWVDALQSAMAEAEAGGAVDEPAAEAALIQLERTKMTVELLQATGAPIGVFM